MSFGGNDKRTSAPARTCWAGAWRRRSASSSRVRITPVVSVVGDGSFCFSGPQPLWTQARYKAPIVNIVLNNHSYNNERNRIWNGAGRQFDTGRDMTCYLGSPDVDYAKTAAAFGVDGEVVKEPASIKPALDRAKQRDRGGSAVSARHPHPARRARRSLGLASALFGR